MKWFLLIAAVLLFVYIVLPALGNTTRYGLVAPGGGNGTGAEHQILV